MASAVATVTSASAQADKAGQSEMGADGAGHLAVIAARHQCSPPDGFEPVTTDGGSAFDQVNAPHRLHDQNQPIDWSCW